MYGSLISRKRRPSKQNSAKIIASTMA